MTSSQEAVKALFNKETQEKVKSQFKNGEEIISIDNYDLSFRLLKTKADNINLELLVNITIENSEEQDVLGLGAGRIQKTVMFFKPIGYFTQKKGIFSSTLEVTVLKEFENDLESLISENKISDSVKIHKLSLLENAVLSVFSMETAIRALKYKDDFGFMANGLYLDIYMSTEGVPQVFLNDKYEINGPLAAYNLKTTNTINPMVTYKEMFDRFHKMSLLSAFKRL
jgi:hypothetical protein